jgi:RNA polymerase primary sigma factor
MQESQPGAETAKKDLVEANLRLVALIAKYHGKRGVEVLDLIQKGNTALMRAVDKYDYRRGYRFSTYAKWLVRQSIIGAIRPNWAPVRLRRGFGVHEWGVLLILALDVIHQPFLQKLQ